jgi:hypothetical protein
MLANSMRAMHHLSAPSSDEDIIGFLGYCTSSSCEQGSCGPAPDGGFVIRFNFVAL